jgi:peptidyl-prolyl cis-trans isomerase A (cyclophilin A)
VFCLCFFTAHSAFAQGNALYAFATLKTSMGDIRLKLYKREAPNYVENFVDLATGEKQFRNVKTGKKVRDVPFYQNMIFHKVHPELGIQTGCPWGTGKGWPGYTLKREENELTWDKPYLVGMSRISDDNNSVGSQFFITTQAAPHLNGKYTVIGEVEDGFAIVNKISRVPRDAMMRPLEPIEMKRIIVE